MDYYKEKYENILRDVTVTVKKVAGYTFTVNSEIGWSAYLYIDGATSGVSLSDTGTSSYQFFEGQSVTNSGWGQQSYIYAKNPYNITVTVGGEEIISGSYGDWVSCYLPEFEVTGNVVVTITAQ